jgi:hypothetical protein
LRTELSKGRRLAIVCDIDGGELSLLNPEQVPELRSTIMLVETHDCFVEGITSALERRFAPSHAILRRVPVRLSTHDGLIAMDEMRPTGQAWLWLMPRQLVSTESVKPRRETNPIMRT